MREAGELGLTIGLIMRRFRTRVTLDITEPHLRTMKSRIPILSGMGARRPGYKRWLSTFLPLEELSRQMQLNRDKGPRLYLIIVRVVKSDKVVRLGAHETWCFKAERITEAP